MKINIGQKEVIHFIGVGGIGMRASTNYENYGLQGSRQ